MNSKDAIILLRGRQIKECSANFDNIIKNLAYLLAQERKNKPQKMEEIKKRLQKKELSWILIDPYLEIEDISAGQYGGLRVLDEFIDEGTIFHKNKPNFIVLSLDSSETFFDRRFIGKILFRKYASLNKAEKVFYLSMPFNINTLKEILDKSENTHQYSWGSYLKDLRKGLANRIVPCLVKELPEDQTTTSAEKSEALYRQLRHEGACLTPDNVAPALSQLRGLNQQSAQCFLRAADACGLLWAHPTGTGTTNNKKTLTEQQAEFEILDNREGLTDKESETFVTDQFNYLLSFSSLTDCVSSPAAPLLALSGLIELGAKPDIIIFDDLPYLADDKTHKRWNEVVSLLGSLFTVHVPPLPTYRTDLNRPERLSRFVEFELSKLSRPTAAIVDLYWKVADEREDAGVKSTEGPEIGLGLIEIIRSLKPNIPIFIWSNITDNQMIQAALQRGATYYFNKQSWLAFGHEPSDLGAMNFLNPGKLWFHIWQWEMARYAPPPARTTCESDFIEVSTPGVRKNLEIFLNIYGLKLSDLSGDPAHPVVELLRRLVPGAVSIEILNVLGGGHSGGPVPFLVRGKTAMGRKLKPMQVKISKDWRSLARERKGYRDVIGMALGPTVAQVINGPFRIGDWCGMAQTFAAPEESYADAAARGTRTLESVLRDSIADAEECSNIVDRIFKGILCPLYEGISEREPMACHKAFVITSPAQIEGTFLPVQLSGDDFRKKGFDFSPLGLSRKNEAARCEEAFYKWEEVRKAVDNDRPAGIKGLVIDTVECDPENPLRSRLRLTESTLGIKVDLYPNDARAAERWRNLQDSPIKLSGLPVSFCIHKSDNGKHGFFPNWKNIISERLSEINIQSAKELCPVGGETVDPINYVMKCHPLDFSEKFAVGPIHGDLNITNILLHRQEGSCFPWLIDFDQSKERHPIVFDLVKLELEAYHRVGAGLFVKLDALCKQLDGKLFFEQLFKKFEELVDDKATTDLSSLWCLFPDNGHPPESLKRELAGFFSYVKAVHRNVEAHTEVTRQEYLIASVYYGICCLKFKNLYRVKDNPCAPFPAKLILYKVQSSIRFLDKLNGIVTEDMPALGESHKVIRGLIGKIRTQRCLPSDTGDEKPFAQLVAEIAFLEKFTKECFKIPQWWRDDVAKQNPTTRNEHSRKFWELTYCFYRILKVLRDQSIPGNNRWFREVLWYIRDFAIGEDWQVAAFTLAMVLASQDEELHRLQEPDACLVDYASTGRVANTFPVKKFFERLAKSDLPFVKVSSRGESGGTIDILEGSGMPICRSLDAVDHQKHVAGWAVAEAAQQLCGADKIMMALRKETNCMKVDDLVISSISAKKLALGIGRFHIQVSSGYDAKFRSLNKDKVYENHEALGQSGEYNDIGSKWQRVWLRLCQELLSDTETYCNCRAVIEDRSFNTSELSLNGDDLAVIGSAFLGAAEFKRLCRGQNASEAFVLKSLLPARFIDRMKTLGDTIDELQTKMSALIKYQGQNARHDEGNGVRYLLTGIQRPQHLKNVRWTVAHQLSGQLKDLSLLMIAFSSDSYVSNVVVPFFDNLYSSVVAKSGHPLSSILFFKQGLAILLPVQDLVRHPLSDINLFCWQILRNGFCFKPDKDNYVCNYAGAYMEFSAPDYGSGIYTIGPD